MTSTQVLHHSIIKGKLEENQLLPNKYSARLQYSRSSTKRIYESVFKIIDFDGIEQPDLEQSLTNSIKVHQILSDENALTFLYQKMKDEGVLDHYPILKVCCEELARLPSASNNHITIGYNSLFELQYNDIAFVFQRFGDMNRIIISQDLRFAYVFFTSFHSAYVASKLLNGMEFTGKMAKLHVNWSNNNDYEFLMPNLNSYLNIINWHLMYKFCSNKHDEATSQQSNNISQLKQNKLTCRYDIQIQNERDFQVARRIIGSKGYHMKKIIQDCIDLAKKTSFHKSNPRHFDNINQLLKLRLRGKGSGYKQGPEQMESDESLHLCVSAKDEICYQLACEKVQKLLQGVYEQYYQFTLQTTGFGVFYEVTKNSLVVLTSSQDNQTNSCFKQQSFYSSSHNSYSTSQNSHHQSYYSLEELNSLIITPNKICELLELRNRARRELNFLQADKIRNFLRNCGICLIDEKGRRGKAMEVTTWKYIF